MSPLWSIGVKACTWPQEKPRVVVTNRMPGDSGGFAIRGGSSHYIFVKAGEHIKGCPL